MRRNVGPHGPSPAEVKLKADLDRARRDLVRLKKLMDAGQAGDGSNGAAHPEIPPAAADSALDLPITDSEVEDLRRDRQRLAELYATQLRENRRRSQKLHQILESIRLINTGFDLDPMLERLADSLRRNLGFRIVLIRVREPGTRALRARAFAGLTPEACERMAATELPLDTFMSWLRDDFKVSRSYMIRHSHDFSRTLPPGHVTPLGSREEWEWHEEDVLLTPLFSRDGELVGYFSVDDPEDRLVPSTEVIELLEIFANHTVVAIENARLYQELEHHARELEAAGQHMQELQALKSNFVSAVSHELRTPLTAIRGYTEMLQSTGHGQLPEAQVQRFLAIINEESQRLSRLIESVLDLSRFESGKVHVERQSVDLRELAEECIVVMESVAQVARVKLEIAVDGEDARVEGDRDQLRQLVLQLGGNAIKFTPAGGSVTLRLDGDERNVRLRVEDTGIGIPKDALEKVFERFYQVDSSLARRYGGTGLGLAVCKSIVDWHSGQIFAESEPGQGAMFTVVLPRKNSPRTLVRTGRRVQAGAEDVLELAMEMVAEVMGARVVSLLTPEPDGDLVIRAAIGLEEDVVREARVRPGTGVAGWVAENRRPVCVSGHERPSEVSGTRREQYNSGTFLSVPLETASGFLGVLNVTEPLGQKTFDAEDCHLLLHLAQRVAAAWEQALQMQQSQASVDTTAESLREVLRHLEHGRRLSPNRVSLARAVARHLGLGESDAGVVSFAASVHDVGMARVGERVIEGPGALSREDRAAIERHPEEGADLLQPLESVGVVRDIVLSHHEWWDGTGYPRALKQDQIPVGARILAAVDAFESMTVGRPHRPAVSREDALAELNRLAGRQFDPQVVTALEKAVMESKAAADTQTEATVRANQRGGE